MSADEQKSGKIKESELLDNLGKIAYTLDKAYMSRLKSDYGVLPFDEKFNMVIDDDPRNKKTNDDADSKETNKNESSGKKLAAISYKNNIRAVKVNRWVFNKEEKPGDCFKNVLSAFADGDHTLAMVVTRHVDKTEMYFVIKNEGAGRPEESGDNLDLLEGVLKGNFQGSEIERLYFDSQNAEDDSQENNDSTKPNEAKREEIHYLVEDDKWNEVIPPCFSFNDNESVAILSNTPSEYAEDYLTQGIDKLLEGIVPKKEDEEYSVIFLAESMSQEDLRDILSGYEDLATAIAPYASYQFQIGSGDTKTTGEMQSIADTKSITESVFKTHSVNVGINGNTNKSRSKGKSVTTSGIASGVGSILGKLAGGAIGSIVGGPAGALVGEKIGSGLGTAVGSAAPTLNESKQDGWGIGGSVGYGYSWGKSKAVSNGTTKTEGTSSSISISNSENTSYTYKSYMVQNLIQKLEEAMKRIARSQSTGLWKFSTYIMAKESATSINVANYLRGLTQGKDSYIEPSTVQKWPNEEKESTTDFEEIRKYLSHFCHPLFVTVSKNEKDDIEGMMVTPTSYISTDDLGYVISFPQKSIQGLPVLEGVQFGREPHSLLGVSEDIKIGVGYHMHQKIPSTEIKLSKEELTKHTFVTGSTGSGKSNTIYKLLDSLGEQDVHYLVIEPAKGEYKDVLGKKENVTVYGTNPLLKDIKMLRINPFRFPKSIHILEHLDRIVEIFNVCWPMYAAMPAILKDAIERAYVAAGWNLETSENKYSPNLFPSFADVTDEVKLVLKESDYSDDNKGDYIGSLVTRLKSLTNGINGLILSNADLPDKELFDERDVIVDLSRVGSSETKSLLMGLLVLKLQEYRMDQRANNHELNSNLKHITVLEEAHNLLRRTSTEQSSESSNLLGKSVEMLANSIAEMRTYGEGFIIADQSPGLLDMSVIRNTNTKIIMRLPDYSDRLLVGKSAGLSDNQINELARIERGVAAITQSDWLEPVLCMIDEYDTVGVAEKQRCPEKQDESEKTSSIKQSLLECIMSKELYRRGDRTDIRKLCDDISKSNLSAAVKRDFFEYIASDGEETMKKLRELVYDFFDTEKAINNSCHYSNIKEWTHAVVDELNPSVRGYADQQVNLLLALLINEKAIRDTEYQNLFGRFTEIFKKEGRVY